MKLEIPFYPQSTDFTCDPACLVMALKHFYPQTQVSRELEFDIWREAYGIGIPGCMPQGLAYSALLRGLKARLICIQSHIVQVSEKLARGENKEIALFTSRTLLEKAKTQGMTIVDKSPGLQDMEKAMANKEIPLVMINMHLLHNQDSPHWIVVTGIDNQSVSINDPYNKHGKDVQVKREDLLQMMDDLERYSEIDKRMLLLSK